MSSKKCLTVQVICIYTVMQCDTQVRGEGWNIVPRISVTFRLDREVLRLLDRISQESRRSRANVLEVLILKEARQRTLSIFRARKDETDNLPDKH